MIDAAALFHKKCGIAITEMVNSLWVYRLRNFRAGIEAAISCFKRTTAPPVAPGADWTTARPAFGPPWRHTT